jgi:hypothetical protein
MPQFKGGCCSNGRISPLDGLGDGVTLGDGDFRKSPYEDDL